jgi:hypothetical protein
MDGSVIVSGVLVFVLGQSVLHFVFEPIKEFNKQRGDTSYLLLRYQAAITNASVLDKEDREQIHEMGAALISTVAQIPFYDFLSSLGAFGLPPKKNVEAAAREINSIVYSLQAGERYRNNAEQNVVALGKIGDLLKIRTSYGSM